MYPVFWLHLGRHNFFMKRSILLCVMMLLLNWQLSAQDKKYITKRVAEGETIESIAKAFAVTPYDLYQLNPDIGEEVAPGDVLVVPNNQYDPKKNLGQLDMSHLNDKDIIVDNYIYHEVGAKETLYSLSKAYTVSEEELFRDNPFIKENGLKIGQVIKIPLAIDEEQIAASEDSTQPYLVKAKETKYSIARKFGISIAYLEELNPSISKEGLKIDDIITVPKNRVDAGSDEFIYHTVAEKETMYSLSKTYGVSQGEITEANPNLIEGLKIGMILKIPNTAVLEEAMFEDEIPYGKELKVAVMLPFKTKQDTLDFETNRLLQVTSDFYFGAKLALDSLKNMGLNIELHVYDTENNRETANRISRRTELQDFDAVIGPLFFENVQTVSRNLKYGKPFIASPISTKDHSGINNAQLIQERASLINHTEEMMAYVKANYDKQDLIVIKNDTDYSRAQFNRIINDLRALNTEKEVQVLEPKDGYIDPELFKSYRDTLDRDIVNWFFVTDKEPAYLGDVFNNLGVFPEQDSLMVFAFEKNGSYDKINNNFLSRVNLHYPTNSHLDSESAGYKHFESAYRRKYHAWPSRYAVEGFDLTYDMLIRLCSGTNLKEQGRSERLSTRYRIIENTSGSLINKGMYIIKYDDLELKVLN